MYIHFSYFCVWSQGMSRSHGSFVSGWWWVNQWFLQLAAASSIQRYSMCTFSSTPTDSTSALHTKAVPFTPCLPHESAFPGIPALLPPLNNLGGWKQLVQTAISIHLKSVLISILESFRNSNLTRCGWCMPVLSQAWKSLMHIQFNHWITILCLAPAGLLGEGAGILTPWGKVLWSWMWWPCICTNYFIKYNSFGMKSQELYWLKKPLPNVTSCIVTGLTHQSKIFQVILASNKQLDEASHKRCQKVIWKVWDEGVWQELALQSEVG